MCLWLISGYVSEITEEVLPPISPMLLAVVGVGVVLVLLIFTAVMIRICKKHKKLFLCQQII